MLFGKVYIEIIFILGRDPLTSNLGLENVGVEMDEKTGFIICNDHEQTSVPNVYAIGDVTLVSIFIDISNPNFTDDSLS